MVVVSAMGKTTDGLLKLASEVSEQPHRRELDMLLSTGERISMALLSDGLTTVEAEAEYDGPGGTGEVRLSWTDSDLFTPPAEGVELICEDPGEDDFCTFLLTVETRDGGQFTCGGNLRFVDPDDEDEEIEPKVVVFSNNGC